MPHASHIAVFAKRMGADAMTGTARSRDLSWRIEETCFNAFPSLRQVLLGDFLLRFARGISRRSNSANPLRAEPRGIAAAIETSERLYRAQGSPAIFRVPSIVDPELDRELAGRGYTSEGETCVLHGPIARLAAAADGEVRLLQGPVAEWLAAMAALQGHGAEQAAIYTRIVGAIAVPVRFALLPIDGDPAALAYGAIHDGLLCYESVITDPARRRQGLARRVVAALAGWAREAGAEGACLQVEAGNAPARALYRGLGMTNELYRYHYRREPAAR
jgi:ribosomal protein S18 acetylase RimI-like enzyme